MWCTRKRGVAHLATECCEVISQCLHGGDPRCVVTSDPERERNVGHQFERGRVGSARIAGVDGYGGESIRLHSEDALARVSSRLPAVSEQAVESLLRGSSGEELAQLLLTEAEE